MKVDCHIHSLHSDGVYTIDEIIPMLLKENIEVFSITDHDCVDGIKKARELSRSRMDFISGIEFTCKEITIESIKKSFSIHLLGYDFDETNSQLLDMLNSRKTAVLKVFDSLCEKITSIGYPIFREDVPISCGNVLQICDIVHYISSKYSDVPSCVYDIVARYTMELNNANISVENAINTIHNAGGKTVWAHPFCVYKNFEKTNINKEEILATLKILRKLGLDGIEAHYLAFSDGERQWLYNIAKNQNMICTAGSDFHGSKGRSCMGVTLFPSQPKDKIAENPAFF